MIARQIAALQNTDEESAFSVIRELGTTIREYFLPFAAIVPRNGDATTAATLAAINVLISVAAYWLQAVAFKIDLTILNLLTPILSCVFLWFLGALILAGVTWFSAQRRAGFRIFWIISIRIYCVIALGTLLNAAMVATVVFILHRNATSPFLIPSLAMFTSNDRLGTFLYQLNISFVAWYALMVVAVHERFGAPVGKAAIWTCVVALVLASLSLIGPSSA